MDDILSTVLTLVGLASLVALRIGGAQKKKKEDAERSKLAAFLASAVRSAPQESSGGDFDAHALMPDEDADEGAADEEYDDEEAGSEDRVYAPAPRVPVFSMSPPVPATVADAPHAVSAPLAHSAIAVVSAVSNVGTTHVERPAGRIGGSSSRLDRLPALRKAVVMSELLGPPLSLR